MVAHFLCDFLLPVRPVLAVWSSHLALHAQRRRKWSWTRDPRPSTIYRSPTHAEMTVYLDCNATTPLEPAVWDVMRTYFLEEYGNAGSRTHEYGARAKAAVQEARAQVASVVAADKSEVVFTSGATESNNIALLGLASFGERTGRRHIISTQIEHKAVLEPLEELERRGFEVSLVPPEPGGWVDAQRIREELRSDTLLVSVMQVNNETGVMQPIGEVADLLAGHEAYLHVDAAQGFGKEIDALRRSRVDLISISAHKIYGPKGVGALVARKRGFDRPPLHPLMFGGGQERGLRPGTLPVPLIVGLGAAAEISEANSRARSESCASFGRRLLDAVAQLEPQHNGDQSRVLPNVFNLTFPGVDSEAVMVAAKGVAALSNGSACTSHDYRPSHVLQAMGISQSGIEGAVRVSWCHLSEPPDWSLFVEKIRALR